MKLKVLLSVIISTLFVSVFAADLPSHPLTFQNWKRVQIHDSTNEVIKLSEDIKALIQTKENHAKFTEEDQKSLDQLLRKKKSEQKAKLENLQYSKQLNFEDYFDVYLSKFSGNKDALDYIAKRLSKESVAYLLQRSLSKEDKQAKPAQPLKK